MEWVYIKYDPKNNLPTRADILPNHRKNEFKALACAVCVTNEANQNLTPSQKDLLQWHFRLGHIGLQHMKWLICTKFLKVQENSRVVDNCERPVSSSCKFGKGHRQKNKINTINKNTMN